MPSSPILAFWRIGGFWLSLQLQPQLGLWFSRNARRQRPPLGVGPDSLRRAELLQDVGHLAAARLIA